MEKWVKLFGIGWKGKPVPKRVSACISVAPSVVPIGRYQMPPKALVEISSVLDRHLWSRFRSTRWKSGA